MHDSTEKDAAEDFGLQYMYDEYTLLEACIERDIDAIQSILDDNPTYEELNERDRSGRTPLSHACSAGLLPVVEVLSEISDVDVNLADKEGNTPLIFAAQAGHAEVVRLLLHDFRKIRVDQKNKAGMTALIKAAIQGRTKCAKLLLYAGANPKLRCNVRRYCAEEWARYCGRKECGDEISKFTSTKRFLFIPMQKKNTERSNSEPDLFATQGLNLLMQPQREKSRSFRRKIKKFLPKHEPNISISSKDSKNPLAMVARCVSTPLLPVAVTSNMARVGGMKRPVSLESVPRVEVTSAVDDFG